MNIEGNGIILKLIKQMFDSGNFAFIVNIIVEDYVIDIKSTAFMDFVMERCDEIVSNDNILKNCNNQIINYETIFRSLLNPEQLKIYLQIEELSMSQKEHEGIKLYIAGYRDACLKVYENA